MAAFDSLKKSPLFTEWADADLKKLATLCKTRSLSPGEALFSEGDVSEAFFFLINGTMVIKKFSRDGEEAVSSFGSGAHFGELAMLHKHLPREKRSATAEAIEASSVLEISFDAFLDLLKASPEAGLAFYKNLAIDLANRIRKTTDDLAGIRALRLRHT